MTYEEYAGRKVYWFAIEKPTESGTAYGIHLPDFEAVSAVDAYEDIDSTASELLGTCLDIIQGKPLPQPSARQELESRPEYAGYEWRTVELTD